jgi:hypothetical protein
MIRTTAALALVVTLTASAGAQHFGHRPGGRPQPVGVIQSPSLPFPGSNSAPSPVPFAPPIHLRHHFVPGPFFGPWGFAPGYWPWPDIYDAEPALPLGERPAPFGASPLYVVPSETAVVRPAPPASPRARLTLDVPSGAQVWLAGKPVDTAAMPIVLESPTLEPGQRYSFDLRVTWPEPTGVQERKRVVTVGAGQSTSLTYTSAGGAPAGR